VQPYGLPEAELDPNVLEETGGIDEHFTLII
jgi:hypothetical protein